MGDDYLHDLFDYGESNFGLTMPGQPQNHRKFLGLGNGIFGNILASVGGALMAPDDPEPGEEAWESFRAKQAYIRSNFGYDPKPLF